MSQLPDFKYHPMCKKLKLTHLIFADDLMFFCKGNVDSVNRVMETLAHFNAATGLEANLEKSNVYLAGVDERVKTQILARTGFSEGVFPIKYLGLPLSPKKWKKIECWSLIDKITHRIKITYSKQLSYAGRLQVINAVLFSIHSFWEQYSSFPRVFSRKWIRYPEISYGEAVLIRRSWYWRKINALKEHMQGWYNHRRYMLIQTGKYSITKSYQALMGPKPRWNIVELVWTSMAMPKHRFMTWLAVQGRLLTQERKLRLQIQEEDTAGCLCEEKVMETNVHLFEDCK
ncbi:hypothetical protein MTR67_038036 [Solanum verrucosum]|uniref:Reverse transcriptase domain-containing protein n=1 Tax=Solanum verrucosum TaxID=315347 RepID=A0AAF0UFP5_SOLVR|nr:hypothetical protein MTR67_038036 [Solanum verrucosum]